jgi:hypothetical protein
MANDTRVYFTGEDFDGQEVRFYYDRAEQPADIPSLIEAERPGYKEGEPADSPSWRIRFTRQEGQGRIIKRTFDTMLKVSRAYRAIYGADTLPMLDHERGELYFVHQEIEGAAGIVIPLMKNFAYPLAHEERGWKSEISLIEDVFLYVRLLTASHEAGHICRSRSLEDLYRHEERLIVGGWENAEPISAHGRRQEIARFGEIVYKLVTGRTTFPPLDPFDDAIWEGSGSLGFRLILSNAVLSGVRGYKTAGALLADLAWLRTWLNAEDTEREALAQDLAQGPETGDPAPHLKLPAHSPIRLTMAEARAVAWDWVWRSRGLPGYRIRRDEALAAIKEQALTPSISEELADAVARIGLSDKDQKVRPFLISLRERTEDDVERAAVGRWLALIDGMNALENVNDIQLKKDVRASRPELVRAMKVLTSPILTDSMKRDELLKARQIWQDFRARLDQAIRDRQDVQEAHAHLKIISDEIRLRLAWIDSSPQNPAPLLELNRENIEAIPYLDALVKSVGGRGVLDRLYTVDAARARVDAIVKEMRIALRGRAYDKVRRSGAQAAFEVRALPSESREALLKEVSFILSASELHAWLELSGTSPAEAMQALESVRSREAVLGEGFVSFIEEIVDKKVRAAYSRIEAAVQTGTYEAIKRAWALALEIKNYKKLEAFGQAWNLLFRQIRAQHELILTWSRQIREIRTWDELRHLLEDAAAYDVDVLSLPGAGDTGVRMWIEAMAQIQSNFQEDIAESSGALAESVGALDRLIADRIEEVLQEALESSGTAAQMDEMAESAGAIKTLLDETREDFQAAAGTLRADAEEVRATLAEAISTAQSQQTAPHDAPPAPTPQQSPTRQGRGFPSLTALLVLLVLVIALGSFGLTLVQFDRLSQDRQEIGTALAAMQIPSDAPASPTPEGQTPAALIQPSETPQPEIPTDTTQPSYTPSFTPTATLTPTPTLTLSPSATYTPQPVGRLEVNFDGAAGLVVGEQTRVEVQFLSSESEIPLPDHTLTLSYSGAGGILPPELIVRTVEGERLTPSTNDVFLVPLGDGSQELILSASTPGLARLTFTPDDGSIPFIHYIVVGRERLEWGSTADFGPYEDALIAEGLTLTYSDTNNRPCKEEGCDFVYTLDDGRLLFDVWIEARFVDEGTLVDPRAGDEREFCDDGRTLFPAWPSLENARTFYQSLIVNLQAPDGLYTDPTLRLCAMGSTATDVIAIQEPETLLLEAEEAELDEEILSHTFQRLLLIGEPRESQPEETSSGG